LRGTNAHKYVSILSQGTRKPMSPLQAINVPFQIMENQGLWGGKPRDKGHVERKPRKERKNDCQVERQRKEASGHP
jgi:hypothetical protein